MLRPPTGQDWRALVGVYWVTSMVEGLGVSQVYALLPATLAELGVPEAERLSFIGLFGSLLWIVGMPLVPLWGVWADKYSRKAVIIRSALVEAVVFAGFALSREPWHVALSILLIGFQLGNTGVMLAGIRDVTPRARLGTTESIWASDVPAPDGTTPFDDTGVPWSRGQSSRAIPSGSWSSTRLWNPSSIGTYERFSSEPRGFDYEGHGVGLRDTQWRLRPGGVG